MSGLRPPEGLLGCHHRVAIERQPVDHGRTHYRSDSGRNRIDSNDSLATNLQKPIFLASPWISARRLCFATGILIAL